MQRGTLLVIPSGRALLYAEPIYLKADRSPMPELRLVVLALQDKLAYGPTFEAALASLYGGGSSSVSQSDTPHAAATAAGVASATAVATQPAQDLNSLIGQAGKDFSDYQRLTADGKLAEAGQKLAELKQVIEKLNAQKK